MSQGNKRPGVNFQQAPTQKDKPPLFSLNASKNGNKFISHLLGLDHELPAGAKAAAGTDGQSALKGVKLADLFQGIKITPNFLFLLLFLGFFFWLFVIYWIRHNEPLANQVLGTPKAHPIQSALDRKLVAGVKGAFPVQTSATTGEIYVPGTPAITESPAPAPLPAAAVTSAPLQTTTSAAAPLAGAYTVQAAPGNIGAAPYINSQAPIQNAYGSPQTLGAYPVQSALPPAALPTKHGSYVIGVQTEAGSTRARTIVSR